MVGSELFRVSLVIAAGSVAVAVAAGHLKEKVVDVLRQAFWLGVVMVAVGKFCADLNARRMNSAGLLYYNKTWAKAAELRDFVQTLHLAFLG